MMGRRGSLVRFSLALNGNCSEGLRNTRLIWTGNTLNERRMDYYSSNKNLHPSFNLDVLRGTNSVNCPQGIGQEYSFGAQSSNAGSENTLAMLPSASWIGRLPSTSRKPEQKLSYSR